MTMSGIKHDTGEATMNTRYVVRAINLNGLEGADYVTVYGACPEKFTDRAEAETWAARLNSSGNWPMGNPGYEVVEIDE